MGQLINGQVLANGRVLAAGKVLVNGQVLAHGSWLMAEGGGVGAPRLLGLSPALGRPRP